MRRSIGLFVLGLACNSKPQGTLELVTGGETDVFSRAPAPTELVVASLGTDGSEKTLARVALPASSVDLGDLTQTDVVSLRVTGQDGAGKRLVFGSTLFLAYGSLQDATFPVFVQRTGEWARMPGMLTDAREAPLVSVLNRRSVLMLGGSDPYAKSASAYDLASLATNGSTATMPIAPRSVALENGVAVLIDDTQAVTYSFTDGSTTQVAAPTGLAYAEISGGSTIVSDDGTSFVVGATRAAGAPSSAVLIIATDGTATVARLLTARLGAAATFVPGRGVLVYGGSTTGAGAEIVTAGATSASALPFPADATAGAAAWLLTGTTVILAGGADASGASAPTRTVDLGCSTSCAPAAWKAPVPKLSACSVFAFDATTALLIGDDDTGATRSFSLTPASAVEIPFKLPRRHARAVVAPTGAIVVTGGASVPESFFP